MPLELDDNQPSNSSVDGALDDAADPTLADTGETGDAAATGADSSDAHGDSAPAGSDSIVRDVVDKSRQDASASPAEGQENGTKETDPAQEDDEEYSDVPFNKHPRFQSLLRRMKTAESEASEYRKVTDFMDQNGLTHEETAQGFVIMALMKRDPAQAWKALQPVVQQLLVAAGEVLPNDLQQRVNAGEFTEEAAREIARERARATIVENGRSFDQQLADRRAQRDLSTQLQGAADNWRRDRLRKDPGFAAKEPQLLKEVAWLIRTEGQPDSPEGVREQLERAYKGIVAPSAPRTPGAVPKIGDGAARPRPSGSSGASRNARPAPQTTRDIINNIVATSRGAV